MPYVYAKPIISLCNGDKYMTTLTRRKDIREHAGIEIMEQVIVKLVHTQFTNIIANKSVDIVAWK